MRTVPINELSRLEGNAGKPIYQMSKWWARRRSCVFRAMLISAAMKAPADSNEAHRAVWDLYYANHQAAGSFKHLRVLDCFMGGGTTLVEGSRLGFQVVSVDLNPIAWFIVKNELACPDPAQVKALFDRIEAAVKPQLQPYYVTDCPRGHKGAWFDRRTGAPAAVDPATLPPEERHHYRYQGPEVIYTFWGKHGPCLRKHQHGGTHRTPVFRTPVIAEKKVGVKYLELTCKKCRTAFHAELGSARMAPGAERVVLDSEHPFTELSQPFASLLAAYDEGKKPEREARIAQLAGMVDQEPGLKCPRYGTFAGELVKDILTAHRQPKRRLSDVKKKDFGVRPARNGTKPVYLYLLIDPEWLRGAPGEIDGCELGGHVDSSPDADAAWYAERLKSLKLIEVRGRIELSEDTPSLEGADGDGSSPEAAEQGTGEGSESGSGAEEPMEYGLPPFITLADGRQINTRRGTLPEESHFTCGACGISPDFRTSVKESGRSAPVTPYAIQGYCPTCDAEGYLYGGRFFQAPTAQDVARLVAAEREWAHRRDVDLAGSWPLEEIPETYMTHQANFALPDQGYTHWSHLFHIRQLLTHAALLKEITELLKADQYQESCHLLDAFQQHLRYGSALSFYQAQYDKTIPHFSNNNYSTKYLVSEINPVATMGAGRWDSCAELVLKGVSWARRPWEVAPPESRTETKDPARIALDDGIVRQSDIRCVSASELLQDQAATYDLVITDPPFGDNLYYSHLANFFYAWLRLPLRSVYPDLFDRHETANPTATPSVQEAVKPRWLREEEANEYYYNLLTPCWVAMHHVLKDGGLLAFTFHHSEDEQWEIVLRSLFDAGFVLEATYPIRSDETKGKKSSFGSRAIEYDIIHVCRKRLAEPTEVSWAKMRQWVKAELQRLRPLGARHGLHLPGGSPTLS